jgi:carboxymethylenebutenolidase
MPTPKIRTQFIQLQPEAAKAQKYSEIGAYEARPEDPSQIKAGLVVMQEIFGVNRHLKQVTEAYAKLGFWVITPAFFDHAEKNVELGYEKSDFEKGMQYLNQVSVEQCFLDSKQAGRVLQQKLSELPGAKRKIAAVGYCLGGSLAWGLSCKTENIFQVASSYYGGNVPSAKKDQPKNPVIFHFGKKDQHIPLDSVQEFQKAHQDLPVHLYDADHGFNNNDKPVYDAVSAKLALERTLAFFAKPLGVDFSV